MKPWAMIRRRRREKLEAARAEVESGSVQAIRDAIGPVPLRRPLVQAASERGAKLPSAWLAEVSRRQMAKHRKAGYIAGGRAGNAQDGRKPPVSRTYGRPW